MREIGLRECLRSLKMKRYSILKYILVIILFFLISPLQVWASDGVFTIENAKSKVELNEQFSIEVYIDSDGEELILSRAALIFDQEYLQITKIERNEGLFCGWDSDRQTADNDNGVIVIEGYCQSGTSSLYSSSDGGDIFARIHFKAVKPGFARIDWEYNGENVEFKSAMMAEGSPPQNILKQRPSGVTVEIAEQRATTVPRTSVWDRSGVGLGVLFIAASIAAFMILSVLMLTLKYKSLVSYNTIVIGEKTQSDKNRKK